MPDLTEDTRLAMQNFVINSYRLGRLSEAGFRFFMDRIGMSAEFVDAAVASKQKPG